MCAHSLFDTAIVHIIEWNIFIVNFIEFPVILKPINRHSLSQRVREREKQAKNIIKSFSFRYISNELKTYEFKRLLLLFPSFHLIFLPLIFRICCDSIFDIWNMLSPLQNRCKIDVFSELLFSILLYRCGQCWQIFTFGYWNSGSTWFNGISNPICNLLICNTVWYSESSRRIEREQ